ncbi:MULTISPECIES: glycerophosphodiester phosphodiesterase [Bacillus]|jgi:glycerophosphoryl diester phosphodiesterase|uniref:Glycerophosphoryl diester phosphodiesterase, putative n=2 Tax=Bacillus cereus group TaxID=86661 RepID=Q737E6_BACC1|nr:MULTISPECIES: glycerophosphodiester phosphodiesterase [Bacillus]AAS41616.1 glycerophosphoryl diester phosphodiesterase, putative [Bacillus cereus ATCC 10987]KMQ36283.1 glycerophosphodiester phosphodiesterase [Bacillus cereus]KXY72266.1 glycerophosphodiester phosphodiesterase [Bacillus cereus]MCU5160219.1 glycerophosphodiester phosphodiesterase [Bacillus pacificus]MCU9944504.1 glycerophosphodiester phosphodiesterase [Bacillus pacificus]
MKKIYIVTILCIFIVIGTFVFHKVNERKYTKAINQSTHIKNIAHRGASAYAPEHTIAAYTLGQQLKGDYIEIDLQMTKDGYLVAMHDETLNRTTNGTGLVKEHTLEEIKQLNAGSTYNKKYPNLAKKEYENAKVPTLEEVIEVFGHDANYYIETKSPDEYPEMEEKLLEIINHYEIQDKVIIQSFSEESLQKIHNLNVNIPLVQLLSYKKAVQLTELEIKKYKTYCIGLGMNYKYIDSAYVKRIKKHGLEVHPFTVDNEQDMKKLLLWGVDGMFTNYPDRLHSLLKF